MNAAEMLEIVKRRAADGRRSIDQQYMMILRESFCREQSLSTVHYKDWISKVTGGAVEAALPDISGENEEKSVDIPLLLSLGDICAADREGTGSYYTPDSVAEFMAENALHQTLNSRFPSKTNLIGRFFEGVILTPGDALTLQGMFCQLRILDMACGNGVFLRASADCYCRLARFSGEDISGLKFVSESLCALDIRKDALESWVISLGRRSKEFFGTAPLLKLASINSVEGDSLFAIPWVKEIISGQGFDLVIGNPPYLGEKGNKEVFTKLREYSFGKRYYEGRMDLFYYFLHRGVDILRPQGILCQLTTSYYATADFASRLRDHLRESGGITGLVSFNDQKVFAGVMGHHLILFYQKDMPEGEAKVITYTGSEPLKKYNFHDLNFLADGNHYKRFVITERGSLFDEQGHMVLDPSRWDTNRLQNIKGRCPETLSDIIRINQGIVSGADRSASGGIFVLEQEERFQEAEQWLVPWFKNGDIRRYRGAEKTEKRLIYIGNEEEKRLSPKLLEHFSRHRDKLSRRRECISGTRPWYGLQWPRERTIFEGPKLVAPQRSSENRFAYNDGPWFASADVYFLTQPAEGISLWALLAYLNSDLMYHWFLHCGKRKGTQLELYATPLRKVPVNREWLSHDSVLDALGKKLYEVSSWDETQVPMLRKQVEDWLENVLGSPIQLKVDK